MSKTLSVDADPLVLDLHTQLCAAEVELAAATAELTSLEASLSPSSSPYIEQPTELTALRARQQLPFAQERFYTAKATTLELRPRYNAARQEAVSTFTAQRAKARLPILQRLADALDKAKTVGDELQAFDRETEALGGRPAEHPIPMLIDELPWRHGEATRIRYLVNTLAKQP